METSLLALERLTRRNPLSTQNLAQRITWQASKQTYLTILLLADRDRQVDAFRAYAYFRWVDDRIDKDGLNTAERRAFVERQSALIERLYLGEQVQNLYPKEQMLAEMIANDHEPDSGLRTYITHMMAVMAFDAERRGRLITQIELEQQTRWLAVAVTEALHHFIGHGCRTGLNDCRYLPVMAAHITHMLRDAIEDTETGYVNLPREFVDAARINPCDAHSPTYRAWVLHRVEVARDHFRNGRRYLQHVENLRCRFAGYAYFARFENVLDLIERDDYRLRAAYPERKSLRTGLKTLWAAFNDISRRARREMPLRRVIVMES